MFERIKLAVKIVIEMYGYIVYLVMGLTYTLFMAFTFAFTYNPFALFLAIGFAALTCFLILEMRNKLKEKIQTSKHTGDSP